MRKGVTASAACLAALTLTAGMAPTASASQVLTKGPGRITIDVQTVNGSGCPRGTYAVAGSADGEAFTVTYSDYMAQSGGDSNPTDMRKNCQMNLRVHIPQGFTYAVASADYRGYANLAKGASGLERANYYFQGMSGGAAVSHTIKGHYDDNWQFTDRTDVAALVWKPCGEDRNLNINTELRVNQGSADEDETSFMSFDSTDGSVKTIYHLAWKKCPQV